MLLNTHIKYSPSNEHFWDTFPWQDFFPDIPLTVNKIPDISLTCFKFPDISRFSRQVVTLTLATPTANHGKQLPRLPTGNSWWRHIAIFINQYKEHATARIYTRVAPTMTLTYDPEWLLRLNILRFFPDIHLTKGQFPENYIIPWHFQFFQRSGHSTITNDRSLSGRGAEKIP